MKSVTTCPSCQTQFLVTDQQLSQFNGKVRCGHCLSVFNAVEYIKVEATPHDASHENATTSEVANTSQLEPNEVVEETAVETSLTSVEPQTPITQEEDNTTESITVSIAPETETTVEASVAQTVIEPSFSKRETLLKDLFEQNDLPLEEINSTLPDREELIIEPVFQDNEPIGLGKENYQEAMHEINIAEEKPEYQYYLEERKTASPVLIFLGAVLILAAILQTAFFYRHTLAMQFPELKPTLMHLCNTLGCKINLPQEIQYFSIDDSTIEEDASHVGVIRLFSTITNRAEFNQAFPNLEVTLTDTQDHPKLRRIFKPKEYLNKEYHLEEGIASGDSISINMPLMADDFKPAGFRLLLSY